jgi:GAF domain-containing protein
VVAYAGIPLVDGEGHALGTLCAIDHKPRHWTTRQVELLKDVAAGVTREIQLARLADAA